MSTDEGQRVTEEDKERSATPSQPQPADVGAHGEEEEEEEGGVREGEGQVVHEVREWMDVMQGGGVSPPGPVQLEVCGEK